MAAENAQHGNLLAEARERHRKGELAQAERLYRAFIEGSPRNIEALALLGTLNAQKGNFEEAVGLLDESLSIEPRQPFALNSLGNALNALRRYGDALQAFDRVLALQAHHATALHNRATSLRALRRPQDALASIDRAIMANPEYPEAFNNRGLALQDLGRRDDALRSYDRALALRQDYPEALRNRGDVLRSLKRFEDALKSYDRAIALAPDAAAYHGRSFALLALGRFADALSSIENAVQLNSHLPYALGQLLSVKAQLCDWRGLPELRAKVVAAIEDGEAVIAPPALLSVACTPPIRRRCAEIHVADRYPPQALPDRPKRRTAGEASDRIRIAYLADDFSSHAIESQFGEIFAHHDKARFALHAVSLGPNGPRSKSGGGNVFDDVIEADGKSDLSVAELLRDRQVDIAVDLMGHAAGGRPGILSFRPAAIQVNYPGFPGTMGADYIDYIVADRTVIRESEHADYAEKIVYLPDAYRYVDLRRNVGEPPSRAAAGLPDSGFVFCSFNSHDKISQEMFGVWMKLVQQVPGSVLWLLQSNAATAANLRRQAETSGVSPDRLVFARGTDLPEHLARHRLADLFLDTNPLAGDLTVSNALSTGRPVLSWKGDSFSGRIGASLLEAAGMPHLVVDSLAAYEAKALDFARNPGSLAEIKASLFENSARSSDAARFTRHLEMAYVQMKDRHRNGGPAAAFAIEPER